jgi:hypothetical protein
MHHDFAVGVRHRSTAAIPITVAHGDGIGPEIMDATLKVLEKAGANLKYEVSFFFFFLVWEERTIDVGTPDAQRGPEVNALPALLPARLPSQQTIEIGEKVYRGGHSSGIAPESWGE